MATRDPERAERWVKGTNTATVLWYVEPREGADVIFLVDTKAELASSASLRVREARSSSRRTRVKRPSRQAH